MKILSWNVEELDSGAGENTDFRLLRITLIIYRRAVYLRAV